VTLKIEATGALRVTEKRKEALTAHANLIGQLFGEQMYAVFINVNKDEPDRVHSINFVFHRFRDGHAPTTIEVTAP